MQSHNHNGQKKTRKEFREEKARKNRKGLIILQVVYYLGRMLIAIVFEILKFFKN